MSRFPLLRIGDTFEMEFDLASNTNEVGTNFDDQWRLQPAAEHAAFGTALRHHFSPVSHPFLTHVSALYTTAPHTAAHAPGDMLDFAPMLM